MGRLEEMHERSSQPMFRGRIGWIIAATIIVAIAAVSLLLRGAPSLSRLHAARAILVGWCLTEAMAALTILLSTSAWRKVMNPAFDQRSARRMLWGSVITGGFFTAMSFLIPIP
jgi:hypothetical protein